jgi:transmembrane sensor
MSDGGHTDALLIEAARWMERARSGDPQEQAAFRDWLSARPEHVAAMDLVERSWRLSPAAARAAGLAPREREAAPASRLRPWLAPMGGLVTAGVAAALLWVGSVRDQSFVTGPHQREQVALADGSRAWLAPSSRLTWHSDPLGRHVTLAGMAAFDVRHQWRAFTVDAGAVRTVDRGTLFSVADRGNTVSVLLAHGGIVVEDRASHAVIATPGPGQRVEVGAQGATIEDVDARDALAWRGGRIVARNATLADIAARFAEQGAPPLHVADPRLAALRLSGSYAADDIEPFLQALASLYPVRWTRVGGGYEVRPQA